MGNRALKQTRIRVIRGYRRDPRNEEARLERLAEFYDHVNRTTEAGGAAARAALGSLPTPRGRGGARQAQLAAYFAATDSLHAEAKAALADPFPPIPTVWLRGATFTVHFDESAWDALVDASETSPQYVGGERRSCWLYQGRFLTGHYRG